MAVERFLVVVYMALSLHCQHLSWIVKVPLVVVYISDMAKQGGGNLTCDSLVCTVNNTFSSYHNYIVLFSYKVVTENLISCYLNKISFWNFIIVQIN